ncbi:MAG: transporter substrate-binding domain-containing protein, partial [Verrucomicrobiae bacterium]|nr:transporter substrate-binding domain-containing protein [Verrucomicrobiae bacterium]
MCRVAWWLIAPWVVSLMVSGAKGETTRSDTGAVVLTAEERAWLQAHAPLRYAPDPAFPPFEFIDQDGQVRGITPELLDLISRRLGVEIAYVRYPTWSEVLAGIRRGEVDLLGTLTRTTEREAFLDFTRPYLEVPIVLFVPKKSTV